MGAETFLSDTERRKVIRSLELEAYASVVTAFRAQGPLTENKKSALESLCKHFSISPGRHRAEVRRAVSDDRLSTIAECSPLTDWERQWRKEGQRLAPSNARFTSRPTTHLPQALTIATLASKLTKSKQTDEAVDKDMPTSAKSLIDRKPPSQRVQNVLKYIIAQNPNGSLAKAHSGPVKPPQKVQSAPTTPIKKPLVEKRVTTVSKTMSPLKALVLGRATVGQTPAKKALESKKSGLKEKVVPEGLECTESIDSSPEKGRPSHTSEPAEKSVLPIESTERDGPPGEASDKSIPSSEMADKSIPLCEGTDKSILSSEGTNKDKLPGDGADKEKLPEESVDRPMKVKRPQRDDKGRPPVKEKLCLSSESVASGLSIQIKNAVAKVIPYKPIKAPEIKQETTQDDKKVDTKIDTAPSTNVAKVDTPQQKETKENSLKTEQGVQNTTHTDIAMDTSIGEMDLAEEKSAPKETEKINEQPLSPVNTQSGEALDSNKEDDVASQQPLKDKDTTPLVTTPITSESIPTNTKNTLSQLNRKRSATTDAPSPVKKQALSSDTPSPKGLSLSFSEAEDTALPEVHAPCKQAPSSLPIKAAPSTDTPDMLPTQESCNDPLPIAPETPVVDTDKLLQTLSTESYNREESELASELGVDPSLLDLSFMGIIQPDGMSIPGTPTTPLVVDPTTPITVPSTPFLLDPPPLPGLATLSEPPDLSVCTKPAPSIAESPQALSAPLIVPSAPIMTTTVTSDTALSPLVDTSSPILATLPVTMNPSELYEAITSPEDGTFLDFQVLDKQETVPDAVPMNTSIEVAPPVVTEGAEPVSQGEPSKESEVVQLTSKDLDILREMGLGDEGVEGIVGGVNEDALLEGIPQDLAATIQAMVRNEEGDSLPWNQ